MHLFLCHYWPFASECKKAKRFNPQVRLIYWNSTRRTPFWRHCLTSVLSSYGKMISPFTTFFWFFLFFCFSIRNGRWRHGKQSTPGLLFRTETRKARMLIVSNIFLQERTRSFDGFSMHSLENSLIDIMRAEQDSLKGLSPPKRFHSNMFFFLSCISHFT